MGYRERGVNAPHYPVYGGNEEMMAGTESERMAKVETKLEQIEQLLTKLDTKFDLLNTAFVPRNEIDEMFRSRDARINELKAAIDSDKSQLPIWIGTIVSLGALVATIWIATTN